MSFTTGEQWAHDLIVALIAACPPTATALLNRRKTRQIHDEIRTPIQGARADTLGGKIDDIEKHVIAVAWSVYQHLLDHDRQGGEKN